MVPPAVTEDRSRAHDEEPMTLQRAAFIAAALMVSTAACSSSQDGLGGGPDGSTDDTAVADTATDAPAETIADAADAKDASEVATDAPTDGAETSDATDASDAADASDAHADAADGDDADGACKPGSIESEACGKCGTRSRLCAEDGGGWLPWGDCASETGECVPKDTRSVSCGRCGTRAQSCDDTCSWVSEVCTGEGECTAGDKETQYDVCGDPTLVKVRTCSDTCSWSTWSDCEPLP